MRYEVEIFTNESPYEANLNADANSGLSNTYLPHE